MHGPIQPAGAAPCTSQFSFLLLMFVGRAAPSAAASRKHTFHSMYNAQGLIRPSWPAPTPAAKIDMIPRSQAPCCCIHPGNLAI